MVIAPAAASVTQILTAQLLLPVATAPATAVVAAVAVTFAAAIAAAIALTFTVTITTACIDVSASALIQRRLMIWLVVTTARQGRTPWSSGREFWR